MIEMKNKLSSTILLVGVLCTAFFLRFYGLAQNPAILNRDEAALAYNALLLAETGTDEWGRYWPVGLESFGDYKLIGYPTILVGLFKIFTPTDYLVRLPAAAAGTVLVLLCGVLAYRLVRERKRSLLLGSIFALCTPFLFFYSRIAFEATVALMLVVISLILILTASLKNSNTLRWIALLLCSVAACFTYNTPYILLPFFIVWIPFWLGIKDIQKWFLPTFLLGCVFVVFMFLLQPITQHKSAITIFSDPSVTSEYPEYRTQYQGLQQTLIGNKYLYYSRIIGSNFIESFSYSFLVTQGGSHPWHQIPGKSHFTTVLYILSMLGLAVTLWKSTQVVFKKPSQLLQSWQTSELGKKLTLIYLLVASVAPATVTVDAPHATRSLLFLLLLIILAVVGASWLIDTFVRTAIFKNKKFVHSFVLIICITFVMIPFSQYVFSYSTRYAAEQPALLLSDFKNIVTKMEAEHATKRIGVIDKTGYAYVLTAWYQKLPAQEFFSTIERLPKDTIGFSFGKQVGRYRFYRTKEEAVEETQVIVEWNDTQKKWDITIL